MFKEVNNLLNRLYVKYMESKSDVKLIFKCQQCNHLLSVPRYARGGRARCPNCAEVIEIPKQSNIRQRWPRPPFGDL